MSNVFGANLWALDQLYHSAAAGLSSYVFHPHDRNMSHYPPLIWQRDDDDTPTVQAEWYGLMWWAMSTSFHSRLLSVTVANSTNPKVKLWASRTSTGALRVACIHKDLAAPSDVLAAVRLDLSEVLMAPYPAAYVMRLTAPSAYSAYGISFMALTWNGTRDEWPSGAAVWEAMKPTGAVYEVDVQPISAALIVFQTPDGAPWEPSVPYHAGQPGGKLRWMSVGSAAESAVGASTE